VCGGGSQFSYKFILWLLPTFVNQTEAVHRATPRRAADWQSAVSRIANPQTRLTPPTLFRTVDGETARLLPGHVPPIANPMPPGFQGSYF
jgi:hypothetical protein